MSQSYGAANVTLRGIGFLVNNIGSESPIATHFDGVYFQRTTGILGSFFDVQRLEVLRGAQGTLYGRNATGGSINVITADPTTTFQGFAQLRSEEHTSELQSLMRLSYAVFCLKT